MKISTAGPEAAVASMQWLRPGVLLMTITGDIDMVTAPELNRHVENATRFRPAHLVLDLSGVTFLGTTGIQILITARDDTNSGRPQLRLVIPADHRVVMRPLTVLGVLPLFPVCPTVPDALEATGGTDTLI